MSARSRESLVAPRCATADHYHLQGRTMKNAVSKSHDPLLGLQAFLFLDGIVRLFIWSNSFMLTFALFTWLDAWPEFGPFEAGVNETWLWKLTHLALLFNLIYVAHLPAFRLVIPTPREGRYETGPGKKLSRQLVYAALIATLTKARYHAPFPGFLVFHIANLPPMRWLMGPIFGPRSRSCYVTDPHILDPYLVSIGRNVTVGIGATIAAHYQERDAVVIRRTVIEDDVVIGALAALSGVNVRRGAVIAAGSIVLPGSTVGENEYWSGNPARRRRVLPPPEERDKDTEGPPSHVMGSPSTSLDGP